MRSIFLFLFSFFFIAAAFAQISSPNLHQQVDSLVNSEMQKQNIPGLSLVITRDGKIDYIKGYGYSNLEHQVMVKPETIFQSGSVGKQFTAFAVMLLVEEGKIKLNDPLSVYFKDAPSSWTKITVKNLLNHTSGMGDYPEHFDYRADYTEDSFYQIIKGLPLEFQTGERSQYSNLGYVMLGILISKVTGGFYGDFIKQRIFEPLGMKTARVINEDDIIPNRSAGYVKVKNEIKNQEWVSPSLNTTADGALYFSALDLAQWEAGLNAGKLLKKESYDLIWKPALLNNGKTYPYGFGWFIDSVNGKRILYHGGTWQGFESMIRRYPEKKLAVTLFANMRGSKTDKIATRIMELYQQELLPPKLNSIKDDEPSITAFVKSFVEKSIEGKLTLELFTPDLGPRIMSRSKQTAAYLSSMGSFKGLELLERKSLGDGQRIHHYRLFFEKEEVELLLTLNRDGKIAFVEGRE